MKMNRRSFLKKCGHCAMGVAAWGTFSSLGLQNAYAAAAGRKLLVINFSGGYDTLSIVQPDIGSLADIRPNLFRTTGGFQLGSTNLNLHPALPILRDQYNLGRMAIMHKVGYGNGSRSHEEASEAFARGVPDLQSAERRGWINRLGLVNFNSMFEVVDLSGGDYSTTKGTFIPTAVDSLDDFGFDYDYSVGGRESEHRRMTALDVVSNWAPGDGVDRVAIRNGWRAVRDSVDRIESAVENTNFSTAYPNTSIGRRLRDADIAFSGLDSKIVYVNYGGFDTHDAQEDSFSNLLPQLNDGLTAFIANMQNKSIWNDLVILCVSEFARTSAENGNMGTDHGFACDQYLIGPSVRGGVRGPDYASSDFTMEPNWLEPELNMLDIYKPLVSHLGYDPNQIFENHTATGLSLFR